LVDESENHNVLIITNDQGNAVKTLSDRTAKSHTIVVESLN